MFDSNAASRSFITKRRVETVTRDDTATETVAPWRLQELYLVLALPKFSMQCTCSNQFLVMSKRNQTLKFGCKSAAVVTFFVLQLG